MQQRYVPDSHEMENPLLWPGTQAAILFPCGFIFAGTQMLVAAEDLSNGEWVSGETLSMAVGSFQVMPPASSCWGCQGGEGSVSQK